MKYVAYICRRVYIIFYSNGQTERISSFFIIIIYLFIYLFFFGGGGGGEGQFSMVIYTP